MREAPRGSEGMLLFTVLLTLSRHSGKQIRDVTVTRASTDF